MHNDMQMNGMRRNDDAIKTNAGTKKINFKQQPVLNKMFFTTFLLHLMWFTNLSAIAQTDKSVHPNLVYVDKNGILRYTKTNAEAAFFGVNYTVPFAY